MILGLHLSFLSSRARARRRPGAEARVDTKHGAMAMIWKTICCACNQSSGIPRTNKVHSGLPFWANARDAREPRILAVFRQRPEPREEAGIGESHRGAAPDRTDPGRLPAAVHGQFVAGETIGHGRARSRPRSEEHTSELQ